MSSSSQKISDIQSDLVTAKESNRILERHFKPDFLFPIFFKILFKGVEIQSEIVNYNSSGARLKIASEENIPSFNKNELIDVDIYLGKKLIRKSLPAIIRWTRQSQDSSFEVGLQFAAQKGIDRTAHRFKTNSMVTPSISAVDPLDPHRKIFFKMIDFSASGLCLQTSLTNRHLLPGMLLEDCTINFPGESSLSGVLEITNTRTTPEKQLMVGCKIINPSRKTAQVLKKYASTFAKDGNSNAKIEDVKAQGLLLKEVKDALSFRMVETEEEYYQALELRYLGYLHVGKVSTQTRIEQMGEGLHKEGPVLAGYLNGQMVTSAELRFSDNQPTPKCHSDLIKLDIVIGRYVEINKFVIHPEAQGTTDIALGMLQQMPKIFLQKGGYDIVFWTTNKLIPFYEMVGAKSLGLRNPHPTLADEYLNLYRIETETFLYSKNLNPLKWKLVYSRNREFLESIGIVPSFRMKFFQRLSLASSMVAFKVNQIRRSYRSKNRKRLKLKVK